MKINYVEKNMRRAALELVDMANVVIDDYQERGYELTLRQLYYQLVARDLIPNTEKSYKHLGTTVSNGRMAGLIDWDAIVDRTRERSQRPAWSSPDEIIRASASQYRIDKWEGQDFRVFVWVEKEALAGVVNSACARHDIQADYVSCRGYMSQSTMWREGRNLAQVSAAGQVPVILHLGDHDSSGIDMTRDNLERLSLFLSFQKGPGLSSNASRLTTIRSSTTIHRLTQRSCLIHAQRAMSPSSGIVAGSLTPSIQMCWLPLFVRGSNGTSTGGRG